MTIEKTRTVFVGILTFNSMHTINDCLESVLDQQFNGSVRVHVLDNKSEDGTWNYLEANYQDIISRNAENVGYALGMNQLFGMCDCDYFIPLNADCVLDSSFIANAVALFDARPTLACIGAQVMRPPNGSAADVNDGSMLRIGRTMRIRRTSRLPSVPVPVDKPNGSCPIYSCSWLSVLEQYSGFALFDSIFDTYGEDIDLALRLRAAGMLTLFSPDVRAIHARSQSSGAQRVYGKRGRLRVNVIAGRYLNAAGSLSLTRLLPITFMMLFEDLVLVIRQLFVRDVDVLLDLGRAYVRVARLARSKRASMRWARAAHD